MKAICRWRAIFCIHRYLMIMIPMSGNLGLLFGLALESILDALVLPAFTGPFRPLEHAALLIVKDAETDGIGRIKERTGYIGHRYIRAPTSSKYLICFFSRFASSISCATPGDTVPNTHASSHIRRTITP